MARTKDPKLEAQRREQVAGAVVELLAEGSWRSATFAAVASRAGVSKGMVTYYYPDKGALLLDAIQRFHDRYRQRLVEVAGAALPVRERLERLIEVAFPSVEVVRAEVRFQTEVWYYAKERPEVAELVGEAYGQFRMACEALLQLGVAEGYVDEGEAEGLYLFVHALIDGLSLHVAWSPDVDLAAARRRLVSLLERWFRGGSE